MDIQMDEWPSDDGNDCSCAQRHAVINIKYHKLCMPCFYLRAVGRTVLWSSACVCLCVCAHCFCPQDISRTGTWITTKFGGWEQGVNL